MWERIRFIAWMWYLMYSYGKGYLQFLIICFLSILQKKKKEGAMANLCNMIGWGKKSRRGGVLSTVTYRSAVIIVIFNFLFSTIFVHICTSEIIGATIQHIPTMMDPMLWKGVVYLMCVYNDTAHDNNNVTLQS